MSSSDEQIAELGRSLDKEFGGLDFFVHGAAFAKAEDLAAPFSQTSREGFRIALDVSAYSFIALAREVRPLMQKRGGGSMLTLTYLGSERVFKNYNVMGVAKAALESSVRYLAAELGPENIRVNAISAGPIKTLAAMGISGFSSILGHYREHAPLQKNTELGEVADAALFLLGPAGRGVTAEILMVDAGLLVMGVLRSHALVDWQIDGIHLNDQSLRCESDPSSNAQLPQLRPESLQPARAVRRRSTAFRPARSSHRGTLASMRPCRPVQPSVAARVTV